MDQRTNSAFLDYVDPSYFNDQRTAIDIIAHNIDLPGDQTYITNITRIRLIGCRLSEPPPGITKYAMLSILDLCENNLKSLPKNFFNHFPRLSQLDLSSNQFTKFDFALPHSLTNLTISYNNNFDIKTLWNQNLPELVSLKANFCSIEYLPSDEQEEDNPFSLPLPAFRNKLTSIQLDGNLFKKIPKVLTKFECLEEVSLFGNLIESIDNIHFQSQLKTLNISYNNFNDTTKLQFFPETSINSFHISAGRFDTFPISLLSIIELKILCLTRSHLTGTIDIELPPTLLGLDLSHNQITTFSERFAMSTQNLLAFNISYNRIVEFPDSFCNSEGQVFQLMRLIADFNELQTLPPSLLSTPLMEHFSVSNNHLVSLPPFKWGKLKNFNVAFNQLQEIPDCFSTSSFLTDINISFNRLSSLPNSMKNCRKVDVFIACGNEFKAIPRPVMCFSQLRVLSMGGNQLTSLPKGFGSFFFLRFLDLSNNNFSVFPVQISGIRGLKYLSLSHNCLTEIPPNPANADASAIPFDLRLLDLSFNKLTKIDQWETFCDNLQSLSLDYNQLTIDQIDFTYLQKIQFLSISCNEKKTPILDILPQIIPIPTLTHFEYLNNETTPSPEVPFRIHILNNNRSSIPSKYSVGYSATLGDRPSMEDSVAFEEFDQNHAIFAICDGHSGCIAAATATKCLCCETKIIYDKYSKSELTPEITEQIKVDIQKSFLKINNLLKSMKINDGTTAAMIYLYGNTVFAAGIGDSRVIRVTRKGYQRLTVDAKPYERDEFDRLREVGLSVSSDFRINKKLAVSQTLGDFWCSDGLYVPPHVQPYEINLKPTQYRPIRKKSSKALTPVNSHKPLNPSNQASNESKVKSLPTFNPDFSNQNQAVSSFNYNGSNNNVKFVPSLSSSGHNQKSIPSFSSSSNNSLESGSNQKSIPSLGFTIPNSNLETNANEEENSNENHNSNQENQENTENQNQISTENENENNISVNSHVDLSNENENTISVDNYSDDDSDDEDVGIIIACDGLWDVMEDEYTADIVRNAKTGADAAVQLKNFAFGLQSKDNISVIVILFKPHPDYDMGMCSVNTVDILPRYEDPEDDDDDDFLLKVPRVRTRR